jgi:hypothetical protein
MMHHQTTKPRTKKESSKKARKVGGIWVDPMCFPSFDRVMDQ